MYSEVDIDAAALDAASAVAVIVEVALIEDAIARLQFGVNREEGEVESQVRSEKKVEPKL